MTEILSKSGYANYRGVKPAAVSNWIARQKLTPPAVRPDGRIDRDLADRQIGGTIDPMLSAGSHRRYSPVAPPDGQEQVPGWSPANQVNFQMLRAKAMSATVDAEIKRRNLNATRGKYMLTESAEAEWARVLSAFLVEAEQSFADLNYQLEGLDARERLLTIRRWWRELRRRTAATNEAEAEGLPQFVEDSAA